jgi:uncharacterized protein YwqG
MSASTPLTTLTLPEIFTPIADRLTATIVPCLQIAATPHSADTDTDSLRWQSKFGGYPYFPKNSDYPRSSADEYLHLLAQFNLAELPHLPDFPKTGILQFFIGDGDFYGLDFDRPTTPDGFRVIYHPEITTDPAEIISDFSFLPPPASFESFPLENEIGYELSFTISSEPLSSGDYRLRKILESALENGEIDGKLYDMLDLYQDTYRADGHKLGGYPHFIQEDPRFRVTDEEEPYILLFQMDSVGEGIMWGDGGIANFFIRQSELVSCNFNNVWYNWDCS